MVIDLKLFLKRDTSDLNARFEVFDERGELKFRIRGKHHPSGESIRITDHNGDAVCKIRRLGFSALSAYTVTVDREKMRMNIACTNGVASVRFHGISFMTRGDVVAGNYDILDADNSIVCVVSKDFAKSTLTVTVEMEDRELFCIAAAVCIDSLSMNVVPALQMT